MSVLQSDRGEALAKSVDLSKPRGRGVVALADPMQTHLDEYRREW